MRPVVPISNLAGQPTSPTWELLNPPIIEGVEKAYIHLTLIATKERVIFPNLDTLYYRPMIYKDRDSGQYALVLHTFDAYPIEYPLNEGNKKKLVTFSRAIIKGKGTIISFAYVTKDKSACKVYEPRFAPAEGVAVPRFILEHYKEKE